MQIAGVSILVLVVGLLLAPRTTTPPRPEESPNPILIDQERTLATMTPAQRVAERVLPFTVTVTPPPPPSRAGTVADWRLLPVPRQPVFGGLVISPEGDVVTSAAGLTRSENVQVRLSTGRTVTGRVRVLDPVTGLAIVHLGGLGPFASSPIDEMPPAPGEQLVGAVAAADGNIVISATVVAQRGERILVSGIPAGVARGLPLFDPVGHAIAVVDAAEGGVASAMLLNPFLTHAERLVKQGRAIPSVSGLALQAIDERLAEVFGRGGALVSDVMPGSPAAAAGVRPGDVLVRVGGTQVEGPDDGVQILNRQPPGVEVSLTMRTGDETVARTLIPDRLVDAPWLAYDRPVPRGVPASEIADPARLAAAGIPADARVLQVNNAPADSARNPAEGLVYVEHAGRRFFAILPEAAGE